MRYFLNPLKLLLPALLAFLLSAQSGNAQNLIGFSPNVVSGWPQGDSAYAGDTALIMGLVKNYSNTPFTTLDTLYIQGTVDTGSFPVPFSIPYDTIVINPLDSQPVFVAFIFDTGFVGAPQFHVGNNVIVVWPIGVGPGSFQPADSVHLNVFIIDTINGIPDPGGAFLRIYPVPANGPLVISSYHPQYHITQVVVFDAMGKEVYNGVPAGQTIDTDTWAPGIYTVQAALSNGTVSWYKIMRQ